MKQFLMKFLEAAAGLPVAVVRGIKNIGAQVALACNAFTPSTHEKTISKFSASAIATRYLLAKSDGTATGITICTQGDRALFVVADTQSTAADLALTTPNTVACIMLGVTNDSVPMIAAAALTVGTIVYPDTGGKVNTYAGAGSGTAFPCGIVVGSPSAQDGDIVEVASCIGFVASAL